MIINLNTLCKVQLTDEGKKIWMSQVDELPKEMIEQQPQIIQAIKSRIDDQDCVELELWAIMNLFGPHLSAVCSPFKVNTLQLSKNPFLERIKMNETS